MYMDARFMVIPWSPGKIGLEWKLKIVFFKCNVWFFNLPECLQDEVATPLDMLCQSGTYDIVHFMGYDVFGEPPGNLQLYRTHQTGFYQHDDCFLIRRWSKHTESMHDYFDVDDIPEPIVTVVNLKHFPKNLIFKC